jgi:DNA replication initiation complex subunit (GINS family)
MLRELVWLRYKKLLRIISENQKVPADLLAAEEAKLCTGFLSFAEAYQRFVDGLLRGQLSAVSTTKAHKRVALRFIKEVPAVIGADMKTYGPFLVEDVASVPVENAKILIKQGLAELVEAS